MAMPQTSPTARGVDDRGLLGLMVRLIAALFTAFHLYTGLVGPFPNLIQRSIHVGLGLLLVYLLAAAAEGRAAKRILFFGFAAVSVVGAANIVVNYDVIISDIFARLTPFNVVVGGFMIVALLEAVRRRVGAVFCGVVVVSLLYALYGSVVPGYFGHRGFDLETVIDLSYLSTEGMWGIITGLSAAEIGMFIIFGAMLGAIGGGEMFIKISLAVAGGWRGGAAQVAAVASSLFGMINGSSAANAATTGTLTIPMMKRLGYHPALAAAVEATASTGGQLMPPIMGIVAFLMAELIGLPYIIIALAAVIPGIIYYVNIMAGIYFLASLEGLKPVPAADRPKREELLDWRSLGALVIPIGLILYLLIIGRTPLFAGSWGTATVVAYHLLFGGARTPRLLDRVRDIGRGCIEAGKGLAYLAVLSPAANMVVALIGFTGVGVKFAQAILTVGESSLFIAMVLGAVVSLILGMGMPTAGAYLLAAAVVAPSLIELGVMPIAAHFFIFYFAIIAAVTPPVCATLFITCAMAGARWETGAMYALRLALGGFIVPFVIVYAPDILLGQGDWGRGLIVAASTTIGVVSLAAATFGRLLSRLAVWERLLLFAAGIGAVDPTLLTDLFGVAALGVVLALPFARVRREARVAGSTGTEEPR